MDSHPQTQRERKARDIFLRAIEIQSPEARAAYMEGACQHDLSLRSRVEALIAGAQQDSFLEVGAVDCPPTSVGETLPTEGPGAVIGRYKLLQKIGEGGMGVVYMAEQTEPIVRKVALKIIKLGMDTKQVVARFEAERQALAMMDHPNIAKVFDAGATEAGRPYFVMELVPGVPITEYCDKNRLSTKERLELFIPACQAIQHAHQKGVIHRDLKPSNVMVTLHDGTPVPKVIDFGIAKATNQKLTEKTLFTNYAQMIGTPAYMSPEQAEMSGLDVDTRTDVYSLGVLLYELLTGTTPFPSKELLSLGYGEMQKVIAEREPPKPSTRLSTMQNEERTVVAKNRSIEASALGRTFQGDLDWIVMKALEKDRTHRYETVNGLAADVVRHLNNEPVSAAAPTFGYQFHKFVRRNRKYARMAGAAAALLIVATLAATWMAIRATRALRAEAEARRAEQEARLEAQERQKQAEAAEAAESRERIRSERLLEGIQLQRAEELLDRQQTLAGTEYLVQLLRANPSNEVAAARLTSVMTLPFAQPSCAPLRHDGPIDDAQFSPDGLRMVTASRDKTARVWDARTGQPLTEPLRHEEEVGSAQFSPDGLRVVTGSWDKTARVWDARSGQPVTEPMLHEGSVSSAQFSPDGLRVVTASGDEMARVWDARTGQPVTEPLRHEGPVHSAKFSADGLRLVTASADRTARVWDAGTGQPVTEPLRHEADVYSAQFSPDGLRVVTASFDKSARVWDVRTGQPVMEPLRHEAEVYSAQFSPDGLRLVTASSFDKSARVWDARTGQPITSPLRHDGPVYYAEFSPDGLRVVTAAGEDNSAQVWDARTGQRLTEPLRHGANVGFAKFSPDGLRVVTTSFFDHTAWVWDVRISQPATEPLRHAGPVISARFSPDSLRVATASPADNTARVWDARTGEPATGPLRHEGGVWAAEFSPDGLRVVTASTDGTARIWDARTGKPATPPLRHDDHVGFAGFSPDGLRVVTTSHDKTARIWDARTGQPVTDPMRHDTNVYSARFSPDGLRVATVSWDDPAVRLWDARTGQPVTEPFRHGDGVYSAQFSPDGLTLLTASRDRTARLWDAHGGQPLTEPLRHADRVLSAEFSPDGQRVVTASADKTARVWDTRTGQPISEPLRHDAAVSPAQFSPDGLRVVTASYDKTAQVWDAHTGQPLSAPLLHAHFVNSAQFSPDGLRVVTASVDGTARVWDVPPPSVPVPDWFLDWAEAWLDLRFSSGSAAAVVEQGDRLRLRQAVANRTDTNHYTRLAKWAQADSSERTISPNAVLSVPVYVQRRIAENSLESLYEALRLSPTNSQAWARLALLQADKPRNREWEIIGGMWQQLPLSMLQNDESTNQALDRLVAAEFSARHALQLDAGNGEAWRALGTVQLQAGEWTGASESAEHAFRLLGGRRSTWELRGDVFARQNRGQDALDAFQHASASVLETNLAAFQARAGLLRKYLQVLPPEGSPTGNDRGEAAFQRDLQRLLHIGKGSSDEDRREALSAWQDLADACAKAGRREAMDRVLASSLEGLRKSVADHAVHPEVLRLAALELWWGNETNYTTIRQRLLAQSAEAHRAPMADLVASALCLRPLAATVSPEKLRSLADRVEASAESGAERTRSAAVRGMVLFRLGRHAEAERLLFAKRSRSGSIGCTGDLIRAMSLSHLGRDAEARDIFEATAARMKPLPADAGNPLAGRATVDDLVLWLVFKEARVLLQSPSVGSR